MQRHHGIILTLIVLLGLVLRLLGLGHESLYSDELYTWYQTNFDTVAEVINQGVRPDAYPPGYQIIVHLWCRVAGDSEAMVRLPSAVAGALWMPAIFLLGWRLFGPEEGLIAAGIMAVTRTPIMFSHEARSYAMFILAVIIAAFFWAGIVRDRRTGDAIGYVLAAAASLYLHPFAVVFVGLSGVVMVVACLRDRKTLIICCLAHAVVILLFVPWLGEFLRDAQTYTSQLRPPGWRHIVRVYTYMFNHTPILIALAVGLLGWLAVAGARRGLSRTEGLLIVWAVLPVAVVVIKSLVSYPILTNRNMLICMPPVVLLVSRGIARLPVDVRWRSAAAVLFILLALADLVAVKGHYTRPHKTQFREAVQTVIEHRDKAPDAMILGWAWLPDQFNYYFERLGSSRRVHTLLGQAEHAPELRKLLDRTRPDAVWYIYAHRPVDPDLLAVFDARYRRAHEERLIKAGSILFRRKDVTTTFTTTKPTATRPLPSPTAGPDSTDR